MEGASILSVQIARVYARRKLAVDKCSRSEASSAGGHLSNLHLWNASVSWALKLFILSIMLSQST